MPVAIRQQAVYACPVTSSFENGDLVEIDSAPYRSHARVRDVRGDRIHLALERGAYLPWTDALVHIRREGEAMESSVAARIVHTSDVTAILELVTEAPTATDEAPAV